MEAKLPNDPHPLSALQGKWLRDLNKEGVVTGVVHSIDEAKALVDTGKSNYP